MKKFLGKLKELILKHKLLAIISFLALLLLLLLAFMVLWMTIASTNSYGSRLDGIEDVEISKNTLSDVSKKIEEYDEVSTAAVRIQGKIIYFTIHYNKGTSKDKAKEIASTTTEEFSDEEKKFYDLEYVLIEDKGEDDEEETFVITGTKHNSLEKITWSKN
jgi:lipopolysaccharide export LptBFGC system permease protein LptF